MKRIRVASTNTGKLREFREILEPRGYAVVGIEDLADLAIVESGQTFEENARIKAETVCARSQETVVADDSGLVVDALGGAPGVRSARYAGVEGPSRDAANRAKLVAALANMPDEQRAARFVCALAQATPGQPTRMFRGVLEGRIGWVERGHNGFGYDPVFLAVGETRTLAEMAAGEKNKISHRGQALRAWLDTLTGRG